ncbi:MAG: hypothetical protein AB9866_12895 [Syntrophobacteraceae bacterium]
MERKELSLEQVKFRLEDFHDRILSEAIMPFQKLASMLKNNGEGGGFQVEPEEYGAVLSLMVDGAISRAREELQRDLAEMSDPSGLVAEAGPAQDVVK